jgi:hypothetical protein
LKQVLQMKTEKKNSLQLSPFTSFKEKVATMGAS